jgi:hypothetical protein
MRQQRRSLLMLSAMGPFEQLYGSRPALLQPADLATAQDAFPCIKRSTDHEALATPRWLDRQFAFVTPQWLALWLLQVLAGKPMVCCELTGMPAGQTDVVVYRMHPSTEGCMYV